MRIAYFDPFAGASGDMILGALVDAGLPLERLREVVARLDLPGVELRATRALRHSLAGTLIEVLTPVGGSVAPVSGGSGDSPDHFHAPAAGHALHRRLDDLLGLVARGGFSPRVAQQAERVLRRLAEAEARVHGTPVEAVHFHEVGAVDTVVDVVGALAGLEALGVERVVCGPLPVGRGFVRAAHGLLPVPPPAVAALTVGVPTRGVDLEGELVTPTGAAILTALADQWGPQPPMTVERLGYGAGRHDFPIPNLLRLFVGESAETAADVVAQLETNVDDMSPELYEHVTTLLFGAGALDVWTAPIQMKKGRPATLLGALCPPERAEALLDILFRETTTFGVRRQELRRDKLERRSVEVVTPYGPITVKLGYRRGQLVTAAPEYESCRAAAERTGAPLKEVFEAARRGADGWFRQGG